MITTHVYKPFVTLRPKDKCPILRFGLNAADAAKSAHAYLYTTHEYMLEMTPQVSWEFFVREKAKAFLEVNFKEI